MCCIFLIKSYKAGIAIGIVLKIDKDINPLALVSCAALGMVASAINLAAPNNPIPTFTLGGGSKNPLLIYLVIKKVCLFLIYLI